MAQPYAADRDLSAASSLEGGFADPVFDAQAAFSRIMTALSRPGTIVSLDGLGQPPTPLPQASGAVLLALADPDTPVWLGDGLSGGPVGDWLAFHTGAPLAGSPAEARFACLAGPGAAMLDGFAIGTPDYPDRSTTLVVDVGDLDSGPSLRLSGPGIDGSTPVAPAGLPTDFLRAWVGNRSLYPRGVDLLLVAGDRLIGLPRTTKIEEA